jgi:hypothetical protein
MSQKSRHKVVNSLSKLLLEQEIKTLTAEGWQPVGDPALATPADPTRPPYWVQTMHLSEERMPLENQET